MPSKKVYVMPTLAQAEKDNTNSIHQIAIRIAKYLPMYGWEVTDNPNRADIVAAHAGQTYDNVKTVDVAHCHGFYPTGIHSGKNWHFAANSNVYKNMQTARYITVPSKWVQGVIERELNRPAHIVHWAIQRGEWQVRNDRRYTLWNKTRGIEFCDVCDPMPIIELARAFPDDRFLTTYTRDKIELHNLSVTGKMPFDKMREVIQNANLYVATTKETFGIGTLEAMASGLPVIGYKHGGTADIVTHGETGYLVNPNDIEGLKAGYKWCLDHYDVLSHNAREFAMRDYWLWERVAEQFALIYDMALQDKQAEKSPSIPVSVIIPNHNYQHYLPEAISSVLAQETDFDFELIIIDDKSSDGSQDYLKAVQEKKPDIKVIYNEKNLGVAETRNKAISEARGNYITCLDADDRFGSPDFLAMLKQVLDDNPKLGIAYTGLGLFKDIKEGIAPSNFPPQFDAKKQYEKKNQVPTCNMFRKAAWKQAGGYRKHLQPAEDAGLWLAIIANGWDAKKVSEKPLFYYRIHDYSLSSRVRLNMEKEPNWTMAHSRNLPISSLYPPENHSHPVYDYDTPEISVIIPVGKGHEKWVTRALDSISGQTFWNWEAIVVNDTGGAIDYPYQWIREVNIAGGHTGAGAARNAGLRVARGRYVVFLDADDYLMPEALELMYKAYRETGQYVYTDWYEEREGALMQHTAKEYSIERILTEMSIHAVTVLIPKKWLDQLGGFNTDLPAWEDTDLFIRLAIAGLCGYRLSEPLLVYNYDTGYRREAGVRVSDDLKAKFRKRYGEWIRSPEMCSCNNIRKPVNISDFTVSDDMIKVRMTSGGSAAKTIYGASTRTHYGRRKRGDVLYMYLEDAKAMSRFFTPVIEKDDPVSPTATPPSPEKQEYGLVSE